MPGDYGMSGLRTVAHGDAQANAAIIRRILDGSDTGPRRDVVVLNAAAASSWPAWQRFADGVKRAREAIDEEGPPSFAEAQRNLQQVKGCV